MSTGRGLGDMAVQVACAFSEAFFAVRDDNDGVRVSLGQAHVFAAGRVDLWNGWHSQSPAVKQLVGRFLRLRHNELAAQNRFFAAARRQFPAADAPYALPAGVPFYEAVDIVPMHGREPLEFAAQILDDMEEIQEGKRVTLETATPGTWSFGWQGRSTVELPVQPGSQNSRADLPVVMTALAAELALAVPGWSQPPSLAERRGSSAVLPPGRRSCAAGTLVPGTYPGDRVD
jgi:hypothetical protein